MRSRLLILFLGLAVVLASLWVVLDRDSPPTSDASTLEASRQPRQPDGATSSVQDEETAANPSSAPLRTGADQALDFEFRIGREPAAGTTFFILSWTEENRARAWSMEGLSPSLIEREATLYTADDAGKASLKAPVLPFFLAARAPGSAPYGQLFETMPDSAPISLPPEERLRGRVVTGVERAIVDAQVIARRDFQIEYDFDGIQKDAQRVAGMFFESIVTTDPDGVFEIGGLPAARVIVVARAPGESSHAHTEFVLPMSEPIELVLRSAVDISGLVVAVADGRPIDGARIASVIQLPGGTITETSIATSGVEGRFELRGVPSGEKEYPLRVTRSGYAVLLANVTVDSLTRGEMPILRMKEACVARGKLRSRAGEAVPGAWVLVHDNGTGALMAFTKSGPDGDFLLDFVAPDEQYRVVGSAQGYYLKDAALDDPCSGEDLTIVLDPVPTFEGRVVVEEYPLRDARARLVLEDEVGNRLAVQEAEVDPDSGRFGFSAVDAGTYLLDAWAPGYAPRRLQNVAVLDGAEGDVVEIRLDRGGTVRGVVSEKSTGRPIVGASVKLGDRCATGHSVGDLPGAEAVRTDGEGAFILEHVPCGVEQALVVEHTEYASVTENVIVPGEALSAFANVELARGCTLRISVRDEEGHRFQSLYVSLLTPTQERVTPEAFRRSPVQVFEGLSAGEIIINASLIENVRADLGEVGFSSTVVLKDGEVRDVEYDLAEGVRVHGVVEGPGLAPAERRWSIGVLSAPVDDPDDADRYAWLRWDSSYVLAGVPPGERVFTVRSYVSGDAGIRYSKWVDVQPGVDLELNFHLPESGLRGKVKDADGAALAGVNIWARPADESEPDGPAREYRQVRTHSSESGEYALTALDPGRYGYSVELDGYGFQQGLVEILDEEMVVERDFVLK
ncbi:MAG: carboxypeptidase regulatory-like domain-containing protein, partial [Planctomycetota bacterium]